MSWLKALPDLLANNDLRELARMASFADDASARLERCRSRVAALEGDLAACQDGDAGFDITPLVAAITSGSNMAQVFYSTAALTRPFGPTGPQRYLLVAPDHAKLLSANGEYVQEYYGLLVWTRRADPL